MKLKKTIQFIPAYDKRNADPRKNYGVHGVDIRFILGNSDQGYVQFVLSTNWMLKSCRPAWDEYKPAHILQPFPSDLGYHSRVPMYEGQNSVKCNLLGTCYYDGSTLNAEPIFEILVEQGEKALWKALRNYHKQTFKS